MTDDESRNITKRDLVYRIADKLGVTKVLARDLTQLLLDEIMGELSRGSRIELRDFGVFDVRVRAGRVAQNPRTLERVDVPPKRIVRFRSSRAMRDLICPECEGSGPAGAGPARNAKGAASNGSGADARSGPDAGSSSAGSSDAGSTDAGSTDAGSTDAGPSEGAAGRGKSSRAAEASEPGGAAAEGAAARAAEKRSAPPTQPKPDSPF